MSQVYSIADTLGLLLHASETGIAGWDDRIVDLGPLKVKLPITAFSDIIGEKDSGVFVSYGKSLWSYFVLRGADEMQMYFFDAQKAGITQKTAAIDSKSVNLTLKRLKPYITAVFNYNPDKTRWNQVDAKDMDDFIPK